jgi:hypothetical protein
MIRYGGKRIMAHRADRTTMQDQQAPARMVSIVSSSMRRTALLIDLLAMVRT